MRKTWTGVPKELREAATPLLDKHGHLLPGWVRLLTVTFESEMPESYAQIGSEQSQNRASLAFGGGWLDLDEQEREWVVVHELCHTQLAPMERAWDAMMSALPKKMRAVADKLFEDALEESVSGLAYALVREDG